MINKGIIPISKKVHVFLRHPVDVSPTAIVASLIIEHTVNFALSGNSHGPCTFTIETGNHYQV